MIPAPVFTCDDGSQPDPEFFELSLTEYAEQFQNLTFTHDTATDILTDNFGGVWRREGADSGPERTTPPSEAELTALLSGFLEARVAGDGAQQYLSVPEEDIPLLYATTSGAPYERGEFEQVLGIEWPYGWIAFKVRLFAGDTVVEQLFFTNYHDLERFPAGGHLDLAYQGDGFGTDIAPTIEDGQPLAKPDSFFDGEVTLKVAHPWISGGGGFLLRPRRAPGRQPTAGSATTGMNSG